MTNLTPQIKFNVIIGSILFQKYLILVWIIGNLKAIESIFNLPELISSFAFFLLFFILFLGQFLYDIWLSIYINKIDLIPCLAEIYFVILMVIFEYFSNHHIDISNNVLLIVLFELLVNVFGILYLLYEKSRAKMIIKKKFLFQQNSKKINTIDIISTGIIILIVILIVLQYLIRNL